MFVWWRTDEEVLGKRNSRRRIGIEDRILCPRLPDPAVPRRWNPGCLFAFENILDAIKSSPASIDNRFATECFQSGKKTSKQFRVLFYLKSNGNSSALGGETVVARAGILIPSLYRFLLRDCFFFLFLFSILWRVPCCFSCRFLLSFVDNEEDAETSEGSASCLHHHRRFHPHCHYNRRSDG